MTEPEPVIVATKHGNLLVRFWGFVHEPKVVTIAQSAVYLTLSVFGFLAILQPANTTSDILGAVPATLGSLSMVVGGITGTIGAISGWWWVERTLGLGFVILASVLYVYSIIEAQFTMGGYRWMQMGWVLAGTLSIVVVRWGYIRKSNYDPRRPYTKGKKGSR